VERQQLLSRLLQPERLFVVREEETRLRGLSVKDENRRTGRTVAHNAGRCDIIIIIIGRVKY